MAMTEDDVQWAALQEINKRTRLYFRETDSSRAGCQDYAKETVHLGWTPEFAWTFLRACNGSIALALRILWTPVATEGTRKT